MLLQASNIINDHVISAPGHVTEVVDYIIFTEKRFIFHFMATVQLPGSQLFDTKM